MKIISLFFLLFCYCATCLSQNNADVYFNTKISNFEINESFKKHFDSCGVKGGIVIFDNNNQKWILSDTIDVRKKYLPASTFKIINLLIALETKTIKNENEIIKWVGKTDTVKYGYRPEIFKDMTVKEAFKVSAGWVFIELAKKIGIKNYKKYLSACSYGNLDLSENNTDFWNFGAFAISPINQVSFLKKLYENKLPFSKRNMDIVKRIMIEEEGNDIVVRAKTGWTRENDTNTGWWLGYIEANNNTYFFATILLQDRKNNRDDFGICRKEITKKIFKDLGFLKSPDEKLKSGNDIYNSIDHVPIVVGDLEKIKNILIKQLYFNVKEGRTHEGIKNCFVKFQNGTYLEFVNPMDSTQTIGKYYSDFLKIKQGGTTLALSINNTNIIRNMLYKKGIPFIYDSNKVWQTIEPKQYNLFFIEYANKIWKENSVNTNHLNTAKALTATYILTDSMEADLKKYRAIGITAIEKGKYLKVPCMILKIGQSKLYLLNRQKASKIYKLIKAPHLIGICGFQITVQSLQKLNEVVQQNENVVKEKNKTTFYFKDYNMFIEFVE